MKIPVEFKPEKSFTVLIKAKKRKPARKTTVVEYVEALLCSVQQQSGF